MNTYEISTLGPMQTAALAYSYVADVAPDVWVGGVYDKLIEPLHDGEFAEFLHIKWLLRDLGRVLRCIYGD